MKKIFLVPFLALALTACGTKADFNALYNANVKEQVARTADTMEAWGYVAKEASGKMSVAVEGLSIEGTNLDSASFATDYKVLAMPSNLSHITFVSPTVKAEGSISALEGEVPTSFKGDISVKELEFLSALLTYVKFSDLKVNFETSDSMISAFAEGFRSQIGVYNEKLSGKWIMMMDDSGNSEQAAVITMLRDWASKLVNLTHSDVTKLITDHRFFKAEGEPTVDGTKYTYNVVLDAEQIVKLNEDIKKQTTSTGMTTEEVENLREALKKADLKGTVTYDTQDASFIDAKFVLKTTTQETLNIVHTRNGDAVTFDITSEGDESQNAKIVMSFDKSKLHFDMNVVDKDADLDMTAKLDMSIKDQKAETATFAMATKSSYGSEFDVSLEYKKNDSFVANINAGEGKVVISQKMNGDDFTGDLSVDAEKVATWSGVLKNDVLESLKAKVDAKNENNEAVEVLTLDLAKQGGDMATGKLIFKEPTGEELLSADLSLRIEGAQVFGLIIENLKFSESLPVPMTLKKFEIFSSFKESKTNKKIQIPAEFLNLSEVSKLLTTAE